MTVEMMEALTARISVFFTELRVSESRKSSRYQCIEKEENTLRLLEELKEKTRRIAIGAKRKRRISAV
jgi:hypothetical protein